MATAQDMEFLTVLQDGMDVAPSFPKAFDVLLGTPKGLLDLSSPDKGIENSNSNIPKDTLTPTLYVSKRCMTRTSFFRLFRCWLRDFVYLVLFFLTMKMRQDRLICIHKDLLPEGAIVTHVVTRRGRDHLVNVRSGRHTLVMVIVLSCLLSSPVMFHFPSLSAFPLCPLSPCGVLVVLLWCAMVWCVVASCVVVSVRCGV